MRAENRGVGRAIVGSRPVAARTTIAIRMAVGLAVAVVTPVAVDAQEARPDAAELIAAAETSVFPESFEARVRITNRDDDEIASRMELSIAYRKGEGSSMEVLSPERSRGLRFLQIGDRLWMYNPRAGGGRAIRLSPRAAFQGSTFTNRDLTDPDLADDYRISIQGTETIEHPDLGAVEAWILEASARNDQIAYARIRMWVTRERQILVRSEYYAKSGLLFKRARFERIRDVAGRPRPTVMHMTSEQQDGLTSTMEIESLSARPDLPARIFTQEHLTRSTQEEAR